MTDDPVNHAELLFRSIFGRPAFDYTRFDVERMAYFMATVSSAQLFMRDFPKAPNFEDNTSLLINSLKACSIAGLYLEFGVYTGGSLKYIASKITDVIHGFDSFEGLPEDWTHFQKAGRFSTAGQIPPNLPANVKLHIGWFDRTLPKFLDEYSDFKVRFLHIDSDLYSSARTVLGLLGERITRGTIIVFDDYFNYPNWENGEYKAWQEFVAYRQINFEYFGWASRESAVAIRIV